MNARDEVLARMRASLRSRSLTRPDASACPCQALDRERLGRIFAEEAASQGCVVHRAAGPTDVGRILDGLVTGWGISTIALSDDEVVRGLVACSWAARTSVGIVRACGFSDRDTLREAVFGVDASLTGADVAAAESGTVVMCHRGDLPRLLTVAPPCHIVLVPTDRIVMDLETAVRKGQELLMDEGGQVCLITGPSSTSDIQAVHFKGMHGPEKVAVILVEMALECRELDTLKEGA